MGIAGAAVGGALLAGTEHREPVAVVGHAGPTSVEATTTSPVPPSPAPTSSVVSPKVATGKSSSVVRSDARGVTIVNEGSAVASTGGNTVIGPPDASVSNGPVSAVGNASEVRVTPR